MSGQHTPGRWAAERGGELMPEFQRLIVADLGFNESGIRKIRTIGKVWDNAGAEESLANARLIAAAPDLLEALKLAEKWMGEFGCPPHVGPTIRAAITKATGEQA